MAVSRLIRAFWIMAGFLAIGLGVIGVFLPLLPTTPLLLLGAFCFARSSPVLHDWLITHPRLGPPILDWRDHGAISRRAKILAISAMAVLLIGGYFFGLAHRILVIQAVVLSCVALFILTRPSPPEG